MTPDDNNKDQLTEVIYKATVQTKCPQKLKVDYSKNTTNFLYFSSLSCK